ncbi:MAG TPA: GNAT family N-acetyltransferase [Vicinamibacterales bacterium]|nr:GNAT family N-acetyltransferase [Vicinamibacterales bacterium]
MGPPSTVDATRTYLELTSAADFRPARTPSHRAAVQQVLRCPPAFYRFLYATVGAEYHWIDRLDWTDDQIRSHLAQRNIELRVMYVDGAPAGFFELRRDEDEGVEIAYFGLLKEFFALGLGGYLLSEAVRRAFAEGVSRVWLHTSSLDHPAALHNYLERGFRVFKTERYTAQLRPQP